MPDNIVYKAGTQDPHDPWEFVLSTPTRDAYGDIVEADWVLSQFHSNPIALWMHEATAPIGTWSRLRLDGNLLRARLTLAAQGTSQLVDELRSLVEQRILRACSVGFYPGKAEPIDPDKPWAGFRLTKNVLVEASLVSVPANRDALNTNAMKSALTCAVGDSRCTKSAWTQLRASGASVPTYAKEDKTMSTLADRIGAYEAQLNDLRTKSDAIMAQADGTGILADADQTALDGLTEQMTGVQRMLKTLRAQEQIRAGALVGTGQPAPAPAAGNSAPAPRIETRQARQSKPGLGVARAVACMLRGMHTHTDPAAIAERVYADDSAIAMLVRAASAPADTSTATWAGNLIVEEWGPFWKLIRDQSIYGQLPGRRIEVMTLTNMPVQAGRGTLAAGFTGPGSPIKVKKGSIGTSTVVPNKLAVISAYLNELIERQTVEDMAAIIQEQMVGDTVEAVDTALFSTTARNAGTTPAGIRDTTETGGDNINAATNAATGDGNATDEEVLLDSNAVLSRVNAIKVNAGAWVMHPNQVRALEVKMNAITGQRPFADSLARGQFRGFPVIQSTNATAGVVAFIGDDCMVFANELMPRFSESKDATLHFEDTTPLAIGTAGTPNTVAAPVRSAFQEDFTAIRMIANVDWRVVRQGGVQVLTGAAAW